jgi:cytochrome c oxidase assembly protein subunit 15
MAATPTVDLQPLLPLAGLALAIAAPLLLVWWRRQRGAGPAGRLAALTALTLFLTFDLIAFGAFTRLTDSGLGCPDWPGCYGEASPLSARDDIHAAQTALPSGPVTHAKAWIEMIHRYLAMTVGLLILIAAALAWRARRLLPHSWVWSWATLAWVLVQGLFGKYTVTLKLYPAVVTAHLLGALVLLALLVLQHESFRQRPLPLPAVRRSAVALVLAVVVVQVMQADVLACAGINGFNEN